MKIIKFICVAASLVICTAAAIHFTKTHIEAEQTREKTLAELIIGGQAAQGFEEAVKEVEEAIGTTAVEPTTTAITTTTVPTTTTVTTTTIPETEATEVAATATEIPKAEIVTEYTVGGLIDLNTKPEKTMTILTLTSDQRAFLQEYMIEHYFLNGFAFVSDEKIPEIKERKNAAAEMESAAIQTVNMLTGMIDLNNPMNILDVDFDEFIKKIEDIENGFEANYGNTDFSDDNYDKLKDGSLKYFAQLKTSLGEFKEVADAYHNSSNAFLAMGLLTRALTETVIPELMNVLESSFDLVESSQPIFLENTQGHTILTRDEVKAILQNPGYIF
ncbi:MAG: hypothetical protein LBM87_02180 [Ruminococcus sp.]|jgi:hypothetical protein|nr:hypothetical protein [Ruminococcus sp.]